MLLESGKCVEVAVTFVAVVCHWDAVASTRCEYLSSSNK